MKQKHRQHELKQKTIVTLVAMALPTLLQISVAEAACTTSTTINDPNLVTCTEGSSYTNPANTSVTNSAVIQAGGSTVTSSAVKMDGNGNTFTNNGTIANNATYLNTLSASAGQKFGVYIGSGTGTDESLVNAMINNGSISAVIDINNTTNKARLNTTAVVGLGTDVPGEYTLDNTGTISATHNGVGRVNGVEAGGDVEEMTITNSGTITGTASSAITKTTSTATSFQGTTSNFSTAASIGVAAGIYAEEEVFGLNIDNSGAINGVGTYASGVYTRAVASEITNSGTISGTKIGVAQVSDSGEIRSMTLENSGTITGDILSVNGAALRWWSLSNGESTSGNGTDTRLNINSQWGQADSTITNSGEVNGDIYYSNGTHVLTNESGGQIIGNIDLDQRDTTCAQASTTNAGCGTTAIGANTVQTAIVETVSVNGNRSQTFNVYNLLTAAAGVVTTDKTGLTLTSSATNPTSLSQDAATLIATGSTYTGVYTTVGTKSFTFENAGTFDGDLTIRTASSTKLGDAVVSNITLIPTITGAGGATADTASSTGIAGMGNIFNVITTAGGGLANITLAPKIASGVVVKDGEFYQVAATFKKNDANASSTDADSINLVSSNSLVSWTAGVNSSNALVIESEVANASSVAGISSQASTALNALMGANNALSSTFANYSSDAQVAQAAQTLVPEVNGASVNAAQQASGASMQVINNRNSSAQVNHIASLSGQSGIATGDQANTAGVWMQGIGFNADQDKRKGADGYDVDAYGFAFGVDRIVDIANNLRIGAALTYSNSQVDAKGTNKGDGVDVDSYIGAIYASANMGDWYLNATGSIGQHQYDSKRLVVGGRVTGDYDAKQYALNVDAGMPIKTSYATIIPVVYASYSYLDIDGYTEKGLGGLKVSSQSIDSFRTGLGARALFPIYKNNSYIELRGIWFHEFADNQFDTTARFTTGGSSFKTSGVKQDRDSANLGASLRLMGDAGKIQQSLLLTYDAEVKDQYLSHTGSIQVRFDF